MLGLEPNLVGKVQLQKYLFPSSHVGSQDVITTISPEATGCFPSCAIVSLVTFLKHQVLQTTTLLILIFIIVRGHMLVSRMYC